MGIVPIDFSLRLPSALHAPLPAVRPSIDIIAIAS
jgi:hypothetical protein